jgi:hypothetical protein
MRRREAPINIESEYSRLEAEREVADEATS